MRNNSTLTISLVICGTVALLGLLAPSLLSRMVNVAADSALRSLSWFFMLAVTIFLVASLYLAFSRYGLLRLSPNDEPPEFSTFSWLSMLFAAGMGVGLLFWGVAEPITHYTNPPIAVAGTPTAARQALVLTNFHWGFHAWGVYCLSALVLAYFGFRKQQPHLPGSPLRFAFQGRWVGPTAHLADMIGVIAVAFGVAGSLGMGILQLRAGLSIIFGTSPTSMSVALFCMVVVVLCYLLSATTGLDKGIKLLSNANMIVAIALLLFILAVGPTSFLLKNFVTACGDYISSIVGLSLRLYPFRQLQQWTQSWTLTYFIWWIAWAPFVGVFIARISRGRTIREFVLGVLIVPTVFSVLWFAVFGGTALFEETRGLGGIAQLVREDVAVALFSLLERFPLSKLVGGVALVLISVFLITSADSATFVLGMLTSKGVANPTTKIKVLWGLVLALMATATLLAGNVHIQRAFVVSGAIPFSFVMLLQFSALWRCLKNDGTTRRVHDDQEGRS